MKFRSPKSLFQKLLLNKSLASESQMSEEKGKADLANAPDTPVLRVADQLVLQYGGVAKDWIKKGSSSYKAADGTRFETHWYQNDVLGLKVEFKTKLT